MLSNTAAQEWLTYTSLSWHRHYCFVCSLYLRSFCLVLYLSIIILPIFFSLPACSSVRLCAVFNVRRGHMSTPNATEQIRYFVCVHSSFGPIHVLAFCYCHACWGFLRCPPRGRNTFQRLSFEAHIHTLSCCIFSRLTCYVVHRTWCLRNYYCGKVCA